MEVLSHALWSVTDWVGITTTDDDDHDTKSVFRHSLKWTFTTTVGVDQLALLDQDLFLNATIIDKGKVSVSGVDLPPQGVHNVLIAFGRASMYVYRQQQQRSSVRDIVVFLPYSRITHYGIHKNTVLSIHIQNAPPLLMQSRGKSDAVVDLLVVLIDAALMRWQRKLFALDQQVCLKLIVVVVENSLMSISAKTRSSRVR
jgi:uncharacterized membrane protein YobD (UPF0266 family)